MVILERMGSRRLIPERSLSRAGLGRSLFLSRSVHPAALSRGRGAARRGCRSTRRALAQPHRSTSSAPGSPGHAGRVLWRRRCAERLGSRPAIGRVDPGTHCSGTEVGRPVEGGGRRPDVRPSHKAGELCAQLDGFSLHARVHIRAGDRARLSQVCRYISRPPIASERLSLTPDGRVLYRLRAPFRDGTSHFVFDPAAFLERIAALVPLAG